jgi:hypothetical protein
MIIAGIDYSMRCPCITIANTKDFCFDKCSIHYLTDTPKYAGTFANANGTYFEPPKDQIERFIRIGQWASGLVSNADMILLEDYAMGARGKVFHIAENTGILKYFLYVANRQWKTLAPTSLKKYATGKGNSDKNAMYRAFLDETKVDLMARFKRKGVNVTSPISDIVDSFYLCKYLFTSTLE